MRKWIYYFVSIAAFLLMALGGLYITRETGSFLWFAATFALLLVSQWAIARAFFGRR